jgi:hypothetical protein
VAELDESDLLDRDPDVAVERLRCFAGYEGDLAASPWRQLDTGRVDPEGNAIEPGPIVEGDDHTGPGEAVTDAGRWWLMTAEHALRLAASSSADQERKTGLAPRSISALEELRH